MLNPDKDIISIVSGWGTTVTEEGITEKVIKDPFLFRTTHTQVPGKEVVGSYVVGSTRLVTDEEYYCEYKFDFSATRPGSGISTVGALDTFWEPILPTASNQKFQLDGLTPDPVTTVIGGVTAITKGGFKAQAVLPKGSWSIVQKFPVWIDVAQKDSLGYYTFMVSFSLISINGHSPEALGVGTNRVEVARWS